MNFFDFHKPDLVILIWIISGWLFWLLSQLKSNTFFSVCLKKWYANKDELKIFKIDEKWQKMFNILGRSDPENVWFFFLSKEFHIYKTFPRIDDRDGSILQNKARRWEHRTKKQTRMKTVESTEWDRVMRGVYHTILECEKWKCGR